MITVVLVSVLVLSLPPMLLGDHHTQTTDTQPQTTVSVRHTDDDTYSEMDMKELTLYETAAQIAFDAPKEAIKAQAVACYTLLCYQQRNGGKVESTCLPFPSSYTAEYWQTTLGAEYETAMNAYRTALAEVDGKQVLYDGQPIMALSHAVNSGTTESGEVLLGQTLPYLQSVASPADASSPTTSKTVTVPLTEASDRLTTLLGSAPPAEAASWFGQAEKTQAGTVKSIPVCGQAQTGYALQTLFSLPSASFDVAVQGETLVFTVRGQGHLAGMSVCGATAMATDGQTYEQILKHYYAGVMVE